MVFGSCDIYQYSPCRIPFQPYLHHPFPISSPAALHPTFNSKAQIFQSMLQFANMSNSSSRLNTSHWVQVDRPWSNRSQSHFGALAGGCPPSQPASKALPTMEAWLNFQSTTQGPYHTLGSVRVWEPSREAPSPNTRGTEIEASTRGFCGRPTSGAHREGKT